MASVPSFFTVRTTLLFSVGGSAAAWSCFGSWSQNCFESSGVTTMKMMSSTSTTSTSGVTFICGVARFFFPCALPTAMPMASSLSSGSSLPLPRFCTCSETPLKPAFCTTAKTSRTFW